MPLGRSSLVSSDSTPQVANALSSCCHYLLILPMQIEVDSWPAGFFLWAPAGTSKSSMVDISQSPQGISSIVGLLPDDNAAFYFDVFPETFLQVLIIGNLSPVCMSIARV